MLFLMTMMAGFICFWSWKQFQELKWKSYFFIPWLATALLIYLNWFIIAALAFFLFVLSLWMKTEKFSVYIRALCIFGVMAMGFEFFLQKLATSSRVPEPEMWIFWLGETNWSGVILGFAITLVFQTVVREKGHGWWIAAAFLVSGLASLGVAWGMFLGDRWNPRQLNSSVFSLVGILIGVLLMGDYIPQFKLQYWLLACLVWICAEIPVFRRQAKN